MSRFWEYMAKQQARRERRERWGRRVGCVLTVAVCFGLGLAFVWAAAHIWRGLP